MPMQIMITNGGPHPPEKWAQVTAHAIIDDITEYAPQVGIGEAQTFRTALELLLSDHHFGVQEHERAALDGGLAHLATPLDPSRHLAGPVAAIVDLASRHSFADYFQRPETQGYLRHVLGNHFATVMHIERSWRADRTDDPDAVAYRRRHHPGGTR